MVKIVSRTRKGKIPVRIQVRVTTRTTVTRRTTRLR